MAVKEVAAEVAVPMLKSQAHLTAVKAVVVAVVAEVVKQKKGIQMIEEN